MPPKLKCSVDQEVLDLLIQSLLKIRKASISDPSDGPDGQPGHAHTAEATTEEDVDPTDVNSVLKCLLKSVLALSVKVDSLSQPCLPAQFVNTQQSQDNEIDELKQRNLKGNLILTSSSDNKKVNIIKTDAQLAADNESLVDHVLHLVGRKYDVTVPEGDVQALHRLPNGNIILRLWNRRPNSAWSQIRDGIKSGKNKDFNLYANFQLTRKRSTMLYNLRQLKKTSKISKFYSDENGQMSFKISDTGKKHKIFNVFSKDGHSVTLTLDDINNIISKA